MVSGFDGNLLLALAIVAVAFALFGWHLVSTTRRVGLLVSEGRVPRRLLLLGAAAGLGLFYVTRR